MKCVPRDEGECSSEPKDYYYSLLMFFYPESSSVSKYLFVAVKECECVYLPLHQPTVQDLLLMLACAHFYD